MKRLKIPIDKAALVQFLSQGTCCVCRDKGKPIQIHHIDGDNSNQELSNLAVLCIECHNKTLVTGGYGRKLDAAQIILYRDSWLQSVEKWRSSILQESGIIETDSKLLIQEITTEIEVLKENKDYTSVAMLYDIVGNFDLRDKYIDMALKRNKDVETEIYLRNMQGKIDLVSETKIQKRMKKLIREKAWNNAARLATDLGDWDSALAYYCMEITDSLKKDNVFTAAYYLKELNELKLHEPLFERQLKKYRNKKDIWWQVRSLQELGRYEEIDDLLKKNKTKIEKSGNLMLQRMLYKATGEQEKLLSVIKQQAASK